MTDLLALVHKQQRFAYKSLTNEIKDFAQVTPDPDDGSQQITDMANWVLGRLKKREAQSRITKVSLKYLARQNRALTDLTRSWTVFEEDWEQKFKPPRKIPTKALGRRAILAGQELVQVICSEAALCKRLDLNLQCSSITVVPFLDRLYAGGFDSPAPYIVAPRWGYTQPWNWVAYAHETGHHIYRNVKGLRDELKVNLIHHLLSQDRSDLYDYPMLTLWYNWLEETFADLFGLLQMGRAYAKTQRYIVLAGLPSRSLRELTENDNPRILLLRAHDFTHPTPYIRVDLARKALQMMGAYDQATFEPWDRFFDGLDEEAKKHVRVQTYKLHNGRTTLDRNRIEATDTLKEIGHQVVQLILQTELYSLASTDDRSVTPRTMEQVFSRSLPRVLEAEEATMLPDEMDIRDVVRWAVDAFERQDPEKLGENSEAIIERFAPAITVPTVGFKRYAAQEGDTIKRIAQKLYHDPNKYELIRAANSLQRQDKIHAGQEYVIPFFR